ncbi:unnamed protein product [Diabrotica balteata]|uniref:Uncharacterized protein n=1 Tax=Diabrotica balteata TaxID=107213 RepID=A0A9N9T695_DIABA|nr:unnamed protein product [Diabrotica balteata]
MAVIATVLKKTAELGHDGKYRCKCECTCSSQKNDCCKQGESRKIVKQCKFTKQDGTEVDCECTCTCLCESDCQGCPGKNGCNCDCSEKTAELGPDGKYRCKCECTCSSQKKDCCKQGESRKIVKQCKFTKQDGTEVDCECTCTCLCESDCQGCPGKNGCNCDCSEKTAELGPDGKYRCKCECTCSSQKKDCCKQGESRKIVKQCKFTKQDGSEVDCECICTCLCESDCQGCPGKNGCNCDCSEKTAELGPDGKYRCKCECTCSSQKKDCCKQGKSRKIVKQCKFTKQDGSEVDCECICTCLCESDCQGCPGKNGCNCDCSEKTAELGPDGKYRCKCECTCSSQKKDCCKQGEFRKIVKQCKFTKQDGTEVDCECTCTCLCESDCQGCPGKNGCNCDCSEKNAELGPDGKYRCKCECTCSLQKKDCCKQGEFRKIVKQCKFTKQDGTEVDCECICTCVCESDCQGCPGKNGCNCDCSEKNAELGPDGKYRCTYECTC